MHVEDGRVVGMAIETLDALARRAGLDLEYLPVPASLIPSILSEGKADAAFPLAINPERLAVFDFSDPVLVTGGGFSWQHPLRHRSPLTTCGPSGSQLRQPGLWQRSSEPLRRT